MQRDDEVRRDDVLDDGDDVTFDRDADTVIREDPDAHATPGGAAVAGAITGGAIGLAGGPVGAAIGAVGGAIVGAVTERVMHADEEHAEGEHVADTVRKERPVIEREGDVEDDGDTRSGYLSGR